MFKKTVQLLVIIFVMMRFNLNLTNQHQSITHAQSDGVIARLDEAMQHLSTRLGHRISRQINEWAFAERRWTNPALGCGVPGDIYPTALTNGYHIRITVNDFVYTYRVKDDGSILILCTNGVPDVSSIGIDTTRLGTTTNQYVIFQSLPTGTDWVWLHDKETDTLNLFNRSGLQATLLRPQMPNEIPPTVSYHLEFAISRDGRYLVETAPLNNGHYGLGFYSFETGEFIQIHETEEREEVLIESFRTRSPILSDQTGQRIAAGFFNGETGNLRLIIFDFATGHVVAQLDDTDIGLYPYSGFPNSFYYAVDETIHFHMLPWGTDDFSPPPAYAWNLQDDMVVVSPYSALANIDINPNNGEPVWLDKDTSYPSLPDGMSISYNVIMQGLLGNGTTIWVEDTNRLVKLGYTMNYAAILFQTIQPTPILRRWHVLDLATEIHYELSQEVHETYSSPTGFWSLSGDTLAFHDQSHLATGQAVFTDDLADYEFIWSSMPKVDFALTQIAIPD